MVNTQSCAQQPPQLLPNSTGMTIDQNFCGYTPAPQPLCQGGVCVIASDNSGAAGPNHYFQAENFSAVIFDKTGQVVLGPFSTATFWSGFTSPNNTCSQGWSDAIVLYDHNAQRWFVSRFAAVPNSDSTTSWYQCFAVSTTTDSTGTYNRYVFAIDAKDWNDYPKFGIWPDAYYMTANNRFDVNKATAPIAQASSSPSSGARCSRVRQRGRSFSKSTTVGFVLTSFQQIGMATHRRHGISQLSLARPLDTNLGWPASAMEIWAAQVNWTTGTGVLSLQDTLAQGAYSTAICNMSQNAFRNRPRPRRSIRLRSE